MVLEELIDPKKAERRPWKLFFIGIIYVVFAIAISSWMFYEYISMMMVVLVTIAATPLMYMTMRFEEEKDLNIDVEEDLLKEHAKAVGFFVFLFFGFVLAFTAMYLFLPSSSVDHVFSIQTATISQVRNEITGSAVSHGFLMDIFTKNIKILLFCLIFSFFFGAGAIYILAWNASVIGAAIGNVIRMNLSSVLNTAGFVGAGTYFKVYTLGVLQYAVHGIPEIAAYFIAGLAGGIISVAIMKHELLSKRFNIIMRDSMELAILAVAILLLSAFIEVYVSPMLILTLPVVS